VEVVVTVSVGHCSRGSCSIRQEWFTSLNKRQFLQLRTSGRRTRRMRKRRVTYLPTSYMCDLPQKLFRRSSLILVYLFSLQKVPVNFISKGLRTLLFAVWSPSRYLLYSALKKSACLHFINSCFIHSSFNATVQVLWIFKNSTPLYHGIRFGAQMFRFFPGLENTIFLSIQRTLWFSHNGRKYLQSKTAFSQPQIGKM
jgi:hypothetical protein